MCTDSISLTLVYLCVSVQSGMCVSVQACRYVCVCVCACVCWDTWCTCVKQMTPMPVWVSPRCGWCMDHVAPSARGHIGSIVLGSSLNVAPNLHWVKERFTSSAQPFDASEGRRGRSVLDQPPAGRIRCYLSDWGHHHQSLLSTFLCPESNQHRVIHLRWRRADKISNRVCQNFAMFGWCVKGAAIIYLSLCATGLAFFFPQRTLWLSEILPFRPLILHLIPQVMLSHRRSTANKRRRNSSPGAKVVKKANKKGKLICSMLVQSVQLVLNLSHTCFPSFNKHFLRCSSRFNFMPHLIFSIYRLTLFISTGNKVFPPTAALTIHITRPLTQCEYDDSDKSLASYRLVFHAFLSRKDGVSFWNSSLKPTNGKRLFSSRI